MFLVFLFIYSNPRRLPNYSTQADKTRAAQALSINGDQPQEASQTIDLL